jgi:hypothetical protein
MAIGKPDFRLYDRLVRNGDHLLPCQTPLRVVNGAVEVIIWHDDLLPIAHLFTRKSMGRSFEQIQYVTATVPASDILKPVAVLVAWSKYTYLRVPGQLPKIGVVNTDAVWVKPSLRLDFIHIGPPVVFNGEIFKQ